MKIKAKWSKSKELEIAISIKIVQFLVKMLQYEEIWKIRTYFCTLARTIFWDLRKS
nr:MAG TPA: hypothetical protein [Herelleviridae sp.]